MKQWKQKLRRTGAAITAIFLLFSLAGSANAQTLIPCGKTTGIRLDTEGLIVSGVVEDSPAARSGIEKGDMIISMNGEKISDIQVFKTMIQSGDCVVVCAQRNGKTAEFFLEPEKVEEEYRLGLYLRNGIAGIGTITYYDPATGRFGALGHGVYDPDGGGLIRIQGGSLISSSVAEVRKGTRGDPGQLTGVFDASDVTGAIACNTDSGIFGTLDEAPEGEAMETAADGEAELGDAFILANVSGTQVCAYSVRIDRLYPGAKNGRNMLITVTDPALLQQTGGIVQGMSGSPIIQNGKLIGAVTHVLVNAPEKGYGIFINTMLEAEKER